MPLHGHAVLLTAASSLVGLMGTDMVNIELAPLPQHLLDAADTSVTGTGSSSPYQHKPDNPEVTSPLRAIAPTRPAAPRALPAAPRAQPTAPRAQPAAPRAQPAAPRAQPATGRQQVGPCAKGFKKGLGGLGSRPGELWAENGSGPARRAAGVPPLNQLAPTSSSGGLRVHPAMAELPDDPHSTARRTHAKRQRIAEVEEQRDSNIDIVSALIHAQEETSKRETAAMTAGFNKMAQMLMGVAAISQGRSLEDAMQVFSGHGATAAPSPSHEHMSAVATPIYNPAARPAPAVPMNRTTPHAASNGHASVGTPSVAGAASVTPGFCTAPRQLDLSAAAPYSVQRQLPQAHADHDMY